MNILFFTVWICWLLSEILLNMLFRAKTKNSEGFDKSSMALIWLTITVSVTLGVLSAINIHCPVIRSGWLNYFGLIIIVSGMIIRFFAIKTLGRFFTVDLSIQESHELITKGMYKFIRHPSYTGSLLSFLGFALSLNNWISLVIIVIPVLISFLYRIHIEEKLLFQQLGSKYTDYIKITKRLIPFVY